MPFSAPVAERADIADIGKAAPAPLGASAAVGEAPPPLRASVSIGETGDWDDWDDDVAENVDDDANVKRLAEGLDGEPTAEGRVLAARASRTAVATRGADGRCTISGDEMGSSLDTALVCLHCSHDVYRFANARWVAVDYFWVRNFAPDARLLGQEAHDLAKLARKLEDVPQLAAYSCGCSWQTVREAKALDPAGSRAQPHGGARLEHSELIKWGAR